MRIWLQHDKKYKYQIIISDILSYVEVGMLLALVASADLATTVMLIQLVTEVMEMATWLSTWLQKYKGGVAVPLWGRRY